MQSSQSSPIQRASAPRLQHLCPGAVRQAPPRKAQARDKDAVGQDVCIRGSDTRLDMSTRLRRSPPGLGLLFSAEKKVQFPQEPPSPHVHSQLLHPLPITGLRASGRVYLGTVVTCYILKNYD